MARGAARVASRAAALAAVLAASLATPDATAQMHVHGGEPTQDCAAAAECTSRGLECARTVSPYVAPDGTLWIAWTANGSVRVARADEHGRTSNDGIELAAPGPMLDGGADARPQIVGDARGRIVVAWSVFKDRNYAAQVWLSTSDNGVRFDAPRPLSSDPASQRFPALLADGRGGIDALWIDKRTTAANREHHRQPGAALVHAYSRDGGRTFGAERVVVDRTCECCRLAVTADGRGDAVVAFRRIFDDAVRDHAIVTVDHAGRTQAEGRVSEDRWAIDACPHHGPAVAVTADGAQHVAWFTLAPSAPGTFYARSEDRGAHFSTPVTVGSATRQAGRPSLLSIGNSLWLAWKEFDGTRTSIRLRQSADAGRAWSEDVELASTAGYADHPLLVKRAERPYLSWYTRDEGYRVLPIVAPARTLDVGGYAALRASYAGRPFVLHLWGVTCAPCRAELPQLAALKRRHPEMPLVLVEVEGFPASESDAILRELGADELERWRTAEPADERLRHEIDPAWLGEVPRTLLIATDGRTQSLEGVADMSRIGQWWRTQQQAAPGSL